MARESPLQRVHAQAEASVAVYAPPGVASETAADVGVRVVETFGELELEYAALRKHCVVLDLPQRGVLEITGAERLEFLNRMITQELKGLAPFRVRRSFWLNKKGRIDADLRVIDLPRRTLLEMDVHAVERTLAGLSGYIVSEDVSIRDATEATHRLALHGPRSFALLQAMAFSAGGAEASGPGLPELNPGEATVVKLRGHESVVFREDTTGEPGLELIVPAGGAGAIYEQMLALGLNEDSAAAESAGPRTGIRRTLASQIRLRPAGWHAFNIARIEAGVPLYNLDFGPDSLPAETGVLDDRVSFKKGCYLGQEIVARMHARGHPKQMLVAIKFDAVPEGGQPDWRVPQTGTEVRLEAHAASGAAGEPGAAPRADDAVGAITSATISPMLGARAIAFAQVKYAHTTPGTRVSCGVDGRPLAGEVQASPRFVP